MSYLDDQKTADELIKEFGAACTLSTQAQSGYDAFGNPISTPAVSINGYGVKLRYMSTEVDGSVIQTGDAKFLLSTRAVPLIDMRVTLAGEVWRVVDVKPLSPDSVTVVFYTLQLRK